MSVVFCGLVLSCADTRVKETAACVGLPAEVSAVRGQVELAVMKRARGTRGR